jgi:hypothetical protein
MQHRKELIYAAYKQARVDAGISLNLILHEILHMSFNAALYDPE